MPKKPWEHYYDEEYTIIDNNNDLWAQSWALVRPSDFCFMIGTGEDGVWFKLTPHEYPTWDQEIDEDFVERYLPEGLNDQAMESTFGVYNGYTAQEVRQELVTRGFIPLGFKVSTQESRVSTPSTPKPKSVWERLLED
jgi:hypothetical protein